MKDLSIEELRDGGYLQEANRQFFHPLGLALSIDEHGVLSVIDDRDDLEGWRFEGIDLLPKASLVLDQVALRQPIREAALGYWRQPIRESGAP